MQWQPGYRLKNRPYEIERVLGEGGFGITYKAKHLNFDIPVVIKTPNSKLQRDSNYPKFVESFNREGKQLAKIGLNRHPHIVRVSDFFSEDNLPCIVMDFIEGKNLYDLVLTEGKLTEATAVKYIKQIASALTTCHNAGIIHRDVSPLNIIISNQTGDAILIDFGISMSLQTTRHTHSGNRSFAPWEQMAHWEKNNSKTPQVDIYALAATLYFLVTGEVPLECLARKYQSEKLIEPRQLNSSLSKIINNSILKGMEVLPENRPKSIQKWLKLISVTHKISANQNEKQRVGEANKKNPLNKNKVNFSDKNKFWKNNKLRNLIIALASALVFGVGGYIFQNRHTLDLPVVSSRIKLTNTASINNGVNDIVFSPTDNQVLVIGGRNSAKIWRNFISEVLSPEEIIDIADYSNDYMEIKSVAFNKPSGRLSLVPGFFNGTMAIHIGNTSDDEVKLLDPNTKEEIATIPNCRIPIFSPDGNILVVVGKDDNNLIDTIKLWDLNTNKEAATIPVPSSVHSLAISPDGKTLAIGHRKDITLLNLDTKQKIATLSSHLKHIFSIEFSRDGQTLISGSDDQTIKVWDVINKKVTSTLTGFSGQLESVAFSPDGRIIAIGSWKNIELWNIDNQQKIVTIRGHSLGITSTAFSPDGQTLATGSNDGKVKLWNIPLGFN